jgi:hypothetical protein
MALRQLNVHLRLCVCRQRGYSCQIRELRSFLLQEGKTYARPRLWCANSFLAMYSMELTHMRDQPQSKGKLVSSALPEPQSLPRRPADLTEQIQDQAIARDPSIGDSNAALR